jgi:hypothetical protein
VKFKREIKMEKKKDKKIILEYKTSEKDKTHLKDVNSKYSIKNIIENMTFTIRIF